MTPQEIRDLILNKAEKELNEIHFATYFSDNVLIDLLVNAIVNRKCITFFSTKRNQFDTYKGVPYIERGEIMFKFSLPLIENYMQWNLLLEVKSGDKNQPHFSLIKNKDKNFNLEIVKKCFEKNKISNDLAEIVAGLANQNKKATFYLADTYYNVQKIEAKVYSTLLYKHPVVLFHPLKVGNVVVDFYYHPKPSNVFISNNQRIVQININEIFVFKTNSFSDQECNIQNSKRKNAINNYIQETFNNY